MSKLTFRNSKGNLVDIPAVAATKVKNEFGKILDKATHGGAVVITRHDTPRAVLLDYEEFQSLVRAHSLTDLGDEFDYLLQRMQTPKSRKAMDLAYHASSEELGRAAGKAARTGELCNLTKVQVCNLTRVKPHVLRYWETEFPMLAPQKNRAGRRVYRRKDVEMVSRIRDLLYEEKFTIARAKEKLLDESRSGSVRARNGR